MLLPIDQKQLIDKHKVHMEHMMLGRKTNADKSDTENDTIQ